MHNSIKFSLIALVTIVVSMILAPSAVVMVQAQGLIVPKTTPVASSGSMSGMNMSGMSMSAMPPMTGQTITRDSVTLLLEGKTIPAKGFVHVYDAAPYMIHYGHVALHVPCDLDSKLIVNLLVGSPTGNMSYNR